MITGINKRHKSEGEEHIGSRGKIKVAANDK